MVFHRRREAPGEGKRAKKVRQRKITKDRTHWIWFGPREVQIYTWLQRVYTWLQRKESGIRIGFAGARQIITAALKGWVVWSITPSPSPLAHLTCQRRKKGRRKIAGWGGDTGGILFDAFFFPASLCWTSFKYRDSVRFRTVLEFGSLYSLGPKNWFGMPETRPVKGANGERKDSRLEGIPEG